jgi:hypothetical protein
MRYGWSEEGATTRTMDKGEGEVSLLADHRLDRLGLHVKLDKGFTEGTYAVYVEFDELAARVGFASARRAASEYCGSLKEHLGRSNEYVLGETEDPSRSGDPRRRRDLEATFLSFAVEAGDGEFHDDAITEQFRVAFLRAGQARDQAQARAEEERRDRRQRGFRQRLDELLAGDAYRHLDVATRDRLREDVTALACPPRRLEP